MTNRNKFSQQDWGSDKIDACRGAGQTTSVLTLTEKYMWLPDIQSLLCIRLNHSEKKGASWLPGMFRALKNWTQNKSVRGLT